MKINNKYQTFSNFLIKKESQEVTAPGFAVIYGTRCGFNIIDAV